jgi:hypothetical protein
MLPMQNPERPVPIQSMKKASSASIGQDTAQFVTGLSCCLMTAAATRFFLPNDYVGPAVLGINAFVAAAYAVKEGYSAYHGLKIGMSAEATFETTLLEKKNQ